MTDREALDLIHGALDCQEWTSDTTAAVSVILTAHGYTVREPMLASDFGELEPNRVNLADQLTRHLSEEEKEARALTDAGGGPA